jgi:hypothetical protein
MAFTIRVNGQTHGVDVDDDTPNFTRFHTSPLGFGPDQN